MMPLIRPLTRWEALESGVVGFVNLLTTGNTGPDLSPAPADSQFGLTLFNGNVVTPADPSFSALQPIDSGLLTAVQTELGAQSPGGWTSIGDGLEDSLNQLTDPARTRAIVLFTDGEQNRSRFVTDDGLGLSDTSSANQAGATNYEAIPTDVSISTIGIMSPDSEYLDVLSNLATTHDGHAIVTTNGTDYFIPDGTPEGIAIADGIPGAFIQAGIDALSSNSPLIVASYAGTLGSEIVKLPKFDINQNLPLLMIHLSFSRKFERPEMRAVLDGVRIYKDGTDITQYFQLQSAGSYASQAVLKTDFTLRDDNQGILDQIASDGSYSIKLTKPTRVKDFDYQIIPIADDSRLHAEWGLEPTSRQVFGAIQPAVDLFWRHKPLTGATVYAHVLTPGDDLGDRLARNPTIVEPNQDKQDPNSPGYQKYLYLLAKDPEFVKQLGFQDTRIELTDPDKDGHYEGALPLDDISGEYQIVYQIFAQDPVLNTRIQRLLFESTYVRFGEIDPEASAIGSSIDANGHPQLILKPITTYGRFVGPANAAAIQIEGSQEVEIEDRQDGSYVITFGDIRPESKIAISILGQEVYQGTVCQFGKSQLGELDLEASKIRTKFDADGVATISWQPVVKTKTQKRLLGSGKADWIEIRGPEQTKIQDNGEGNYTMTLVGVKSNSKISVRLSCDEVYRGALSQFGGLSVEPPCRGWFCRFRDWRRLITGRTFLGTR
ncbi:MAG: VWA domain-containing protein [Leptolyngbya sp. SIOISBB]|nr:VWA domain-containing protein [Leptolyngbya sp. SIOISBB]